MRVSVSHKACVGSLLDDFTFMNVEDRFAIADSWKSVSDHNRGATLHGSVKSLLNNFLAWFVQSASSFIKDHNLRILDQSACNSNSLLLATRELTAFHSTDLVVTLVQWFASIFVDEVWNQLIEPVVSADSDSVSILLSHLVQILSFCELLDWQCVQWIWALLKMLLNLEPNTTFLNFIESFLNLYLMFKVDD